MKALEIRGLCAGYLRNPVLRDINMDVAAGEAVCVIGSNGAGKSTLLRAIAAIVPWRQGEVVFEGMRLDHRAHSRAGAGIGHVPEGRWVFPDMSVADHLTLGAYRLRDFRQRRRIAGIQARVLDLFPVLKTRLKQHAGPLSGGEQQMLAIARALMGEPRLLMLDEPSLGLAPIIVNRIFDTLQRLHDEGLTILVVEQNARVALGFCDRGYVLESGRIVLEGPARQLSTSEEVRDRYLGRRSVAAIESAVEAGDV